MTAVLSVPAEALANFTRDFSPTEPVRAVRCEKTRYAFFTPEPDFTFVLVVNNPAYALTVLPAASHTPRVRLIWWPSCARVCACRLLKGATAEFLEDELDDAVLQAIVRRAYALYRLFHGPLQ